MKQKKKHIVIVGGGRGMSSVIPQLLAGGYKVTAVVTGFDSGGSALLYREQLKLPGLGDARVVWSSAVGGEVREVLESRMVGDLPVGNRILIALVMKHGFTKGVVKYGEMVCGMAGNRELSKNFSVLPVSEAVTQLVLTLSSGKELTGEVYLDHPPEECANERVEKMALRDAAGMCVGVREAMQGADMILVGPGSLLGSLVPHFLVGGFVEAFDAAKAKKVVALPGVREFGYRDDTREDMLKRFPVLFDLVLTPKEGAQAWTGELLTKKITDLLT